MLDYIKQFTDKELFSQVKQVGDGFFVYDKPVEKNCIYAGKFLGRSFNNKFIPGVDLLQELLKHTKQWVVVNAKAEWLVICSRDVWGPSVVSSGIDLEEDMHVLVLNKHKEVIGVGRVVQTDLSKKQVAIKMQFDIGNLIRRERRSSASSSKR